MKSTDPQPKGNEMRLIINLIALTWIVAAVSLVAIIVIATAAKAGVLEFSPKPSPRVTNQLCQEYRNNAEFQKNEVGRAIFRRCEPHPANERSEGEPFRANPGAGEAQANESPNTTGGSTPPEDRGSARANPGNHKPVGRSGEQPNGRDFGNGQRGKSE